MKARKITAGLMAMALVGTMALPVSAEEKTTEITASVKSEYTLSIPANTDIDFNATSTNLDGTLKVTGNVLPTQTVTVSTQANRLYNSVQDTSLPYKLMNGQSEFQSATWNENELRAETPKEFQLSIAITEADWNQAEAGDYSGSIVFTATMNDSQNNNGQ